MLTKSEKLWLHNRQAWRAIQRHGRRSEWYSCIYCDYSGNKELCGSSPCRLEFSTASLIDALEFSERVAEKLATDENCGVDEDCPPDMPFGWGRLKAARLAVEEEMDGTD